MSPGRLQQTGPAQHEWLIHFCGRPEGTSPTPYLPEDIDWMASSRRLDEILWEKQLRGFPPFGADRDQPMVCLSESPPDHLAWLLQRGWQPWGLLFNRQDVYDAGGGPVWYAREAQYRDLGRVHRPWAVRFETNPGNRSDWLHEREWRIPLSPERPWLDLDVVPPVGVLLGEPDWEPSERSIMVDTGRFIDVSTGAEAHPGDLYAEPYIEQVQALPELWTQVEHWYWDVNRGRVVSQ